MSSETELPPAKDWQDAVTDAMVCWDMWPQKGESARDALRRLLVMEQKVALDPAVSSEAAALIERGRSEALAERKDWLRPLDFTPLFTTTPKEVPGERAPTGIITGTISYQNMPDTLKAMLVWEEQDEGFWLLHLGQKLAGEVYPHNKGYRWHCKISDWRVVEDDLETAKRNLRTSVERELERPDFPPERWTRP